jgi:hypothetical protein
MRQLALRAVTYDPLEFVSQIRVGVSQHVMGFIDQVGEEIHTGASRERALIFSDECGHLLRDSLEANEPLDPTPSQRHMPSLNARLYVRSPRLIGPTAGFRLGTIPDPQDPSAASLSEREELSGWL